MDERPTLLTTATDVVPADHPCLSGHFPGSPIVPAVVLLERIARVLAASTVCTRLCGVREAKFLRPVRPDQRFTIGLEPPSGGCVTLEVRDDDGLLASARLLVEPQADHG